MRVKDNRVVSVVASLVLLFAAWGYAAEKAKEDDKIYTNPIGMKLKLLPAGSFMMGSDADSDQMPVRKVTLTKPFYIGIHEVTQEQYEKVTGNNPSQFRGPKLPVENTPWNDAVEFCRKLSEMDKTGSYRLPTEAEWEYACRAGTTTKFYWGDTHDKEYLWSRYTAEQKTHEVGTRRPNAWGLYDMSGNVYEWVDDRYADSYTGAKQVDPTGPMVGDDRVVRGGSWYAGGRDCRSAQRRAQSPDRFDSDIGFRVVYVPNK